MWYKFRRHMQHVPDVRTSRELLRAVFDILGNQCLTSANLATNVAAVQSGSSFAVAINNTVNVWPTATAMAALTGAVVPNAGNIATVWAFTASLINGAWTLGVIQSGTAPVVGACALPAIPDNTVVIGYLFLSNGSAGAFTPGTTSLATAGLVLNYVNTVGPFYPITLFGGQ
jgi:hypothetical protein